MIQTLNPNKIGVEILSPGEDYFISMEFIDGVNLRELLNRGQELNEKIPTDVCLYVASEISKGLDYAHSKRGPDGTPFEIVHRDISPHNILVSFDGEVKIVDFGIAKAAMKRETGARGLRAILENAMLDIMYDLPCMTGIRECVVGEEVVTRGEAPLLLYENQVGYA